MTYYKTLIAVADDCPVDAAVVPVARGGRKTVAVLQYEMLDGRPYRLTQEDVQFLSWVRRRPDADDLREDELAALREEFFSKSQACLRASPLPKKYGFGLLFDGGGRVALCPVESEEYRRIVRGGAGYEVVKAMRSSRR
ncbi:DUF6157 family protein [Thermopolyspora sp. NPDC052614]|uniref:DUF6157 family protein n=1 Tax=Thermopolyspora sp. NPDC052614 TaxID=3155682 RepID=UPI00343A9DC8